MKLKHASTSFLLGILWFTCVLNVDTATRRNSRRNKSRNKDKTRERVPFGGLMVISPSLTKKMTNVKDDNSNSKLPFGSLANHRTRLSNRKRPGANIRPSKEPRKFGNRRNKNSNNKANNNNNRNAIFPGLIRPSSRGKLDFVVTTKKHIEKEWCKTRRFKQVVREQGCLSRTIVNNYCYGQCNSFFIPQTNSNDIQKASFMSCGFCKPVKHSTIRVTLLCPGKKLTRHKRKRVVKIKKCRCIAQNVGIS